MTANKSPGQHEQTTDLTNEDLEGATGGAGEFTKIFDDYFKERGIDPHSEEFNKEVQESMRRQRGAGSQTVFS